MAQPMCQMTQMCSPEGKMWMCSHFDSDVRDPEARHLTY